ncbi:MAG: UDP-N-acetylmuramoyl-L-alanine--D-glutamate ligase [Actinomycetia bacterium]|nr:UDP-N-acetylmuramoyl-L-alanine--D-glutamate ligase [Actinomycetes bacterium]
MTTPRRVLVVGLGVNNRPLLPYFADRGVEVVAADRRPQAELEVEGLSARTWCTGPDYLREALRHGPYDEVYLTPGMVKDGPEIRALVAAGARLRCETDLFLSLCPAPVIGITGSAGKTTTTTLVGEMLKADGSRPVFVGGNIGVPLLPRLGEIRPDAWVVMELSSFQLELVERSPHGAALLNLAPNHLDVHGSFGAYVAAKARIFAFQGPDDWLVLPDRLDPVEDRVAAARSAVWRFSDRGPVPRGTYLADGILWWRQDGAPEALAPRAALKLKGAMNVRNALAASLVARLAGARLEAVAAVLERFEGVPHRLEPVAEVDGVRYVNDSIATAPDRTLAALEALEGPLVVIAGGYDKHLDYAELGRALSRRARAVVLLGQTAEKIARAIGSGPVVRRAADLAEAVAVARSLARPGDTVVLSPASASYDQYRNFEERGEHFRALVRALAGQAP